MTDNIFHDGGNGHLGADTDLLMHAVLEADPVPGHTSDFWQNLDNQIDADIDGGGPAQRGRSHRRPTRLGRAGGPPIAPLLVAAALVAAVALVGVFQLVRNSSERITTDGSIAEQPDVPTPESQSPDGVADTRAIEADAGDEVPISGDAEQATESVQAAAPVSSPPLEDGSWRIAPGAALGVSPDGKAAWVRTLSSVGGSGCEGDPARTVWRVPFDGTTPTIVGGDADLGDVSAMFVDNDRIAIVAQCEGYSTSFLLASVLPGGSITDVQLIEVSADLGPFAGLRQVEWQDDGSLRIAAADDTNVANSVFERNGELRSTAVTPGPIDYTIFDDRTKAWQGDGWQLEERGGFVHATPTDGAAFLGTPVSVDAIPLDGTPPILMRADFSGWFVPIVIGADPCTAKVQFIDFFTGDGLTVAEGQGPISALTVEGDVLTTRGFCTENFTQNFALADIDRTIADRLDDLSEAIAPVGAERISNGRFGFTLTPPSDEWQERLPRATNGDGFTFTNGAEEIRVFGTYDVNGQVAAAPYTDERDFSIANPNGFGDGKPVTAVLRSYRAESDIVPGGTFVQYAVFAPDRVIVMQADISIDNTIYVEAMVNSLTIEVLG